jgi:flagellar biosynthesis protein FliQ
MTPEQFVDIFRSALWLVLTLATAVILPALLVGLMVSIFQAAPSINEQTLSFLPRLVVTLLALIVLGHWMTRLLMEFTIELVREIPAIIS